MLGPKICCLMRLNISNPGPAFLGIKTIRVCTVTVDLEPSDHVVVGRRLGYARAEFLNADLECREQVSACALHVIGAESTARQLCARFVDGSWEKAIAG